MGLRSDKISFSVALNLFIKKVHASIGSKHISWEGFMEATPGRSELCSLRYSNISGSSYSPGENVAQKVGGPYSNTMASILFLTPFQNSFWDGSLLSTPLSRFSNTGLLVGTPSRNSFLVKDLSLLFST